MAVTWKKFAFEIDVVTKALFNAHTILSAVSDDTPVALTVAEQTVVGRLTGGNIDDITIGIADNNMVQVDGTANNNEHGVWTANGLAGLTDTELLAALSGDAAAAFDWAGQQMQNITIHNVADNAAKLALTPILGKMAFQADELAFYGCTVIV